MTTFRIAIRNYREKSDPSGRVKLAKITPKVPGKPRRVLEARAKREQEQWKEKGK